MAFSECDKSSLLPEILNPEPRNDDTYSENGVDITKNQETSNVNDNVQLPENSVGKKESSVIIDDPDAIEMKDIHRFDDCTDIKAKNDVDHISILPNALEININNIPTIENCASVESSNWFSELLYYSNHIIIILGVSLVLVGFILSLVKINYELKKGYCDYETGECCIVLRSGDGVCDDFNNFENCNNYDEGDCRPPNMYEFSNCSYNPVYIGDSNCFNHFNNSDCGFDGGDCCDTALNGNGICDPFNNFPLCNNFDGGDCRHPDSYDWPDCPYNPQYIGDSNCLSHYNISECGFDGGDCCATSLFGDGICHKFNSFFKCNDYDGGDCRPPNVKDWPNCPYNPSIIGDGICQNHTKISPSCNFDGGDCCDALKTENRICDGFNNFLTCDFDGGDCKPINKTSNCPHNPCFIGDGICDDHLKNAHCSYDEEDCFSYSPTCCPTFDVDINNLSCVDKIYYKINNGSISTKCIDISSLLAFKGVYTYNGTFNGRDFWTQQEGDSAIWWKTDPLAGLYGWIIGPTTAFYEGSRLVVSYDDNGRKVITNVNELRSNGIASCYNSCEQPIKCPNYPFTDWTVLHTYIHPERGNERQILSVNKNINFTCKG